MKKLLTLLAFTLGLTSSPAAAHDGSSSTYDVNGDGRIDTEERQAMRSLKESRGGDRKSNRKKITTPITRAAMKKEIDQRRNDRFLEADSDGDRVLSEEEFQAIPAVARLAASKANKAFRTLDRDGNHQVSLREFTQKLTELKSKVKSSITRPAIIQSKGAR